MTRVIHPIALLFLMSLPAVLLLGGCRESPVSFYEAPKETSGTREPAPLAEMRSTNSAVDPGPARLEWTKPDSWTERPGSEMRLASFAFTAPAGGEADISVFSFPDVAGGLLANVNRWRGQAGLEPVPDGAIESTAERTQVAGHPAWFVDFAGTPTGAAPAMGTAPAVTGPTRIIGAIVPIGGTSWFFKMIGPDEVVAGQRETFRNFVAGIRAVTPSSPAPSLSEVADPHAGVPGAPPLRSPGPDAMNASAVAPPPGQHGFTFDTPAGWEPQSTSQFRLASFSVPGDGVPAADVSVSAFPGMAGQDLGNVNRWRSQVGLGPVDPAGLAGVTSTVKGAHHEFQMYDFESPSPMLDGGGKLRLLAAMLKQGDTTWFFKMTGEAGLVASQRESFLQFLRFFHLESGHVH